MRDTRRGLLCASLVLVASGPARATPRPGPATLLVPGPADGSAMRWAAGFAEATASGAVPRLAPHMLGGPDGVTAANRFATEAGPDGQTLLVLTGAATQARLVGEPRARFDPAGWLPVCASLAPAMLVGAGGLRGRAAPVRLGLASPECPAAAALLVLDRLGIPATAVLGVTDGTAALIAGRVDAAVLDGVPGPGFEPWFGLCAEGGPVPHALDLLGEAAPSLQAAIRAAGMAASLDAILVLPALTAADRLAGWRAAAQRWVEEGVAGRRLDGPAAAAVLAAATPAPEATLAYREWLLRRFAARP